MIVTNVAGVSEPFKTSKDPTGKTPSRTLGQTFIISEVHGRVVRIQSSIKPELARTASVNFSYADALRPNALMTSIPFMYSTMVEPIWFFAATTLPYFSV